ncbi:MAG: 8-amino-7-oxononanoate synthase [Chloracidobacterium sp.]|nr:8-amino-7-oxononanoate synthase [Chloracidobacterium sp.]MDW8218274.1 8-amino-7-oxononanoate synthase [Acidobacteriota bacterium]
MSLSTLQAELTAELEAIRAADRWRELRPAQAPPTVTFQYNGRQWVNFSSNDYLGLAMHPRLIAAAQTATARWGTGATASRLICGTLALHAELETALVNFKVGGRPGYRALLFNSGYHANLSLLTALADARDVIFSDALNHASLIDGCRLSRATVVVYRHNDVDDLRAKIAAHPQARRKLIVTDAVFSMDGDLAPLNELLDLAEAAGAWVVLDEAHATGVLGPGGRGLAATLAQDNRPLITMGTLGKALGSFGAFVVAPSVVIELLINRARPFIFTTAPPPAPVAAALEAVRLLMESDEPVRALRANIARMATALGFAPTWPTPIFPVIFGTESATLAAMRALDECGFYVVGIRPPTVPPGASRLRLTVTAAHTEAQIAAVAEAIQALPTPRS